MKRSGQSFFMRWLSHASFSVGCASLILCSTLSGCHSPENGNTTQTAEASNTMAENSTQQKKEVQQVLQTLHNSEDQKSAEWAGGTLSTSIPCKFDTAYEAVRMTLSQLGFSIDKQSKEEESGRLTATLSNGQPLLIGLRKSEGNTHVRVRAGFTGDKALSKRFLKTLQKQLQTQLSSDKHQPGHAESRSRNNQGPTWAGGTLEGRLNASLRSSYKASRQALARMNLSLDQQQINPPTATVIAAIGDQQNINIALRAISDSSTTVRIRVGYVGNKQRSKQILKAIHNQM